MKLESTVKPYKLIEFYISVIFTMSINPSRISKKKKVADPLEKKRLRSMANTEHYDSHKDEIQQKKFQSYWYKKVKEILEKEAIE